MAQVNDGRAILKHWSKGEYTDATLQPLQDLVSLAQAHRWIWAVLCSSAASCLPIDELPELLHIWVQKSKVKAVRKTR
jgi:hypothetical protein